MEVYDSVSIKEWELMNVFQIIANGFPSYSLRIYGIFRKKYDYSCFQRKIQRTWLEQKEVSRNEIYDPCCVDVRALGNVWEYQLMFIKTSSD